MYKKVQNTVLSPRRGSISVSFKSEREMQPEVLTGPSRLVQLRINTPFSPVIHEQLHVSTSDHAVTERFDNLCLSCVST